ncbi:MAG: hypothetical protein MK116_02800 [Phycisphaerales bacterium]|nr:hypothetical protein [Phycisphaerales bacterium]
MSQRTRLILGIVAVVVAAWLLWTLMQSFWWSPAEKLRSRLTSLQKSVATYQDAIDGSDDLQQETDGYVIRTLGRTLEEVDHRLRSRLNRLGESVGLKGLSVGTGRSVTLLSPGRSDFKGSTGRRWREEVDFVEVEGTLSGTTTWSGLLELIDRLMVDAWIKKIEGVRVRAATDKSQLQVTIRLTTLFIPGRSPETPPADTWTDDRRAALSELASRSPFLIPAAPTPVATAPSPKPKPRPKPDPPKWQMTGVAGIGSQAEVWIRNLKSGRTRRLMIGDRHDGMVLEAIEGDQAAFRSGETVVSIRVGELVKDTAPVHK